MDTVEANVALGLPVDARNFVLARNILHYLHITDIVLMTNNPQKVATLEATGIAVVAREPLIVRGEVGERDLTAAHELGQYMAAALDAGLI